MSEVPLYPKSMVPDVRVFALAFTRPETHVKPEFRSRDPTCALVVRY